MLEGAPGNHFKAVHYFGMDYSFLAVFLNKTKQANEEEEVTIPV